MQETNIRPVPSKYLNESTIAADNARFMSRVYGWMTIGLLVTSGIAWQLAQNEETVMGIMSNRPLFYALIIAQLGAVFALSLLINKINSITAAAIYFLYAALTGVTFSVLLLVYTRESVAGVFALTAVSFAGLSGFGLVTKKDLGPVGSFCIMGLFGMIGYSLISIFVPSLMGGVSGQVYGAVGVVVFAGLTAYDTQKIKAMNVPGELGSEQSSKKAIYGALTLYLDFINLFLALLRLMGKRRD